MAFVTNPSPILLKYASNVVPITSSTVDLTIVPGFTVQRIVFLLNNGPNDVVISFNTPTGTVGKTILLKIGEGISDCPMIFDVINVRLVAGGLGSASLNYMVVG